jgi:hypothetical protein
MKKKTYTLQSAEPYHDENDIVGWWMDVLAVQGEFVERLFGGGSDLVVMMAIQF